MSCVVEKFLRYAKIDTISDCSSKTHPSTEKQWNLARLLADELQEIGLADVTLDEHAYVTATLPTNIEKDDVPVIGFIAHMDTSPDMSGANVNPQIIENYDGKEIILNKDKKVILSPDEFPELLKYRGQTLITTDGTTLLGTDDKAGIAEIMTAIEQLVAHPEVKHGTIKIAFTPDKEIGHGTDFFDVKKFGADFAYTLDGGEVGELEYENFNAAEAKIFIQGRNVHPGTAKNKMHNAIHIAIELNNMLPVNERPEYTEKYEGFFHLMEFNGTVEEAFLKYIIRDHDSDKFEAKKKMISDVAAFLNEKSGPGTVNLDLKDQYYNMREKILPVMHIVQIAERAMKDIGITPCIKPIRGGTDGARLSFDGLPTPNIFTGSHNRHGKFEFIPIQSMEKAVEVILKIIELSTTT